MKRKSIMIFMLFVLLMSPMLLAGCSGSDNDDATSEGPENNEEYVDEEENDAELDVEIESEEDAADESDESDKSDEKSEPVEEMNLETLEEE